MDEDGGGFTLELQAQQVANNLAKYKGSSMCPGCGMVLSPVEVMHNALCQGCQHKQHAKRLKGRMA